MGSKKQAEEEEEDDPQLIVACPRAVVESSNEPIIAAPAPTTTTHSLPNYISRDEEGAPAMNTRSRASMYSVMDEVMLHCAQLSSSSYKIKP